MIRALHPKTGRCQRVDSDTNKKEGVSKLEKSGSSEVQEFCHYYNDTLLSDTYAFD
jgi:hypothetical protein